MTDSFDIRNSAFGISPIHHRYDVLLLINGVPCVQIELKTPGVNPRRAMEQISSFKNDPGNGYTKTLLCFRSHKRRLMQQLFPSP